jgi:iron complex transport system substrate-binding protein
MRTLWIPMAACVWACAWACGGAQAAITLDDDRGRRIELPAPPQRIVSLLPSLTETVCALQACNRLVGTDGASNHPVSVLALPKLGGLEDTQIERLVALKPDLVLAAGSARAIDRLEALGLRVVALEPKSLQDTERVIAQVAKALGDAPAGPALWRSLQARVAAAAARVPPALRGQKVYFEVAAAPYAAGESSFIGENLARLGLGNVVPAALGPFPKLNPEFVVRAQPDLIMATSRAVAEMPARPGWAALRALREHRHCGFAADRWDVLVRPGPRLAEAAELMADCLAGLVRAEGPASTGRAPRP